MSSSRIRNTSNTIRLNVVFPVASCKVCTAIVPHLFNVNTFIAGCWITVVNPEESTDLHLVARLLNLLYFFRSYKNNFPWTKFLIVLVAKVKVCMAFKAKAVAVFFLSKNKRSSAKLIACTIDAFLCHYEHCNAALDFFLDILDAVSNGILLIYKGNDKFSLVDLAAGHLKKVSLGCIKYILNKFIFVCNDAYCSNCKTSKMAVDKQRLSFVVGNTSDAKFSVHTVDIAVKLCSERRI